MSVKEILFKADEEKKEVRMARCDECGFITLSNVKLPFFRELEGKEYDEFYCGCHGWE